MFWIEILAESYKLQLWARSREGHVKETGGETRWNSSNDGTNWPHDSPLLLILFYSYSSCRKPSLCCSFVPKPLSVVTVDFKQTSKQTIEWNLWSTAHLFHILVCLVFLTCSIMYLHAVLVSSPQWRLKSKCSAKLRNRKPFFFL